MTQYLQFDLGYSPLEAGVRIIPVAAVLLVVAPLSVWVARSVGTKYVVTTGLVLVAIAFAMLSHTTVAGTYRDTLAPFVMVGVGVALALAPCTESVMGSLPRSQPESGPLPATPPCNWGRSGCRRAGTVLNLRYQNMMAPVVARAHVPMSCRSSSTDHSKGHWRWPGALRRSWEPNSRHWRVVPSSQGWTKRS